MTTAVTRILALAIVVGCALSAAHADPAKLVPSSALKAYRGPEGETLALVEVNGSKQMLVYFKSVGHGIDGTAQLYSYEDLGEDRKSVYTNKKRGSKTYRAFVLLSAGRGAWTFIHPAKTSEHFEVTYSEKASQQLTIDEVLAAYHP
jgi:hypothetical protein